MPEEEDDQGTGSARPFWSGTITFGLVSVPVALMPAHKSVGTSLRMVGPEGTPLQRRYFATRDERPLTWDDIVRGYQLEKDKYVVIEDEELERIAPERTRDIDLQLFVKASDIDPIYFERAYYLTPAGDSTKAYRLLARVMEESDRAGIATFVMRGKEYLVAILAENGIMRAETLRFAEEVRTPEMIGLPDAVDLKPAEISKLEKEIAKLAKPSMSTKELVDKSDDRLLKLVREKVKAGKDVVHIEDDEEEDSGDVLDLVALLQRSLSGGGEGGSKGGASASKPAKGRSSRGRTAPASKKSTAGDSGKSDGNGATRSIGSAPSSKARKAADKASAGSSKTKGGGKALASASRSELYERAKELDIPGRSEMTKEELLEAIRRAG